jgi:hypothetical protein
MRATVEERLGSRVNVSEESHFMGALGAALFALDRALAVREPTLGARPGVPAQQQEAR